MTVIRALNLASGLMLICISMHLGETNHCIPVSHRPSPAEASTVHGGNGCKQWILVLQCDSEE